MTNLDSILKSRDITSSTKVHLVKAMIFPVIIYGCESWTMKKAEHWKTDAWPSHRSYHPSLTYPPRVPYTARRSNQSILKEISPGFSLERLMLKLKLQYFGHLMRRADLFEKTLGKTEGRRRRVQQGNEIVGWHHRFNGHEFEQTLGDSEGQGSLVCCSPWGHKEYNSVTGQHY